MLDQSDLFRVGEILIATMARSGATKWPSSRRAFAAAVKKLREAEPRNRLAAQFYITVGPAGPDSDEFREILTLMHSATLISYDSVETNWFNVRVGRRGANVIVNRTQATDEELRAFTELLKEHWLIAVGHPLEEPPQ
jgi:hypothetical protein